MRRLSVLAILVVVGSSSSAHGVLAPAKGSQVVTVLTAGACPVLGFTGSSSLRFSQMVNADGSTTPFTIPPKRIFVITDVTISAGFEPPGDAIFALVPVGSPTAGNGIAARYETVAPGGTFAAIFEFPAGVAVRSGSTVCAQALNITHPGAVILLGVAHGYFAPDK